MDNNKLLKELIIPFLRGEDLDTITITLMVYAIRNEQNAIDFFNSTKLEASSQQNILKQLFDKEQQKISEYIQEYNDWITHKNISNTLLHFLEFLAHKESHRIRYLVKQIYQTRAPIKYQKTYIFLIGTITCAGLYFAQNEAAWNAFLIWIKETLPSLAAQALQIAFQPQNLSLIILIYQGIKYALDFYYIVRNNATTRNHKLKKICRITLTNSLNMFGQLINFMFTSYSNLAGYLFILSGLIDLAWGWAEFYSLKKVDEPSTKSNLTFIDFSKQTERYYYYLKKKKQFQIECIALSITFATSLVSIILGSQILCLGTIAAVLQFFIALTKNYYNQSYEHRYAIEQQTEIKNFYTASEGDLSSDPNNRPLFA